jgi:hypothetical protein
LLVAVADLICLAFLVRRLRVTMAVLALLLLLLGQAYITLVLKPFTQVSIATFWIGDTPAWFWGQLTSALQMSLGAWGAAALGVCGVALLLALVRPEFAPMLPMSSPAGRGPAPLSVARRLLTPEIGLCAGVPLLVFVGGVTSSFLTVPNVSDRNLLVASPFLWGLYAGVYDAAVPPLRPLLRRAAYLALCAIVLVMSAVVITRERPRTEPFRESADWIKRFPQCRGAEIPVINPSPRVWYRPGYAERVKPQEYDRYLGAFARPRLVFAEDVRSGALPADLRTELARRVSGGGCPVLAWIPRGLSDDALPPLMSKLVGDRGSGPAPPVRFQAFRTYDSGLKPKLYGPAGYVIFLSPPRAAAGGGSRTRTYEG